MDNYILPSKDLLDANKKELEAKRYYSLAKLILKKDLTNSLVIPIGVDEQKEKYYIDLKNISGIFIGGETGSGKSVFLDSLIVSLLMKNTPSDLKFLFIDPNKVELSEYSSIPHLISNVAYDVNDALESFQRIINITNERIRMFSSKGVKSIEQYNSQTENKLAHIIIVIDESADIMKSDSTMSKLKQILKNGKSLGIHLILATNAYFARDFDKEFINMFTYVLSFDLASHDQAKFINLKDSNLLKVAGEALVKVNNDMSKIQTPYISDDEINRVVEFIKNNNE